MGATMLAFRATARSMGAAPSIARSTSAARSRIETTSLSGSAVTPSAARSSSVNGVNLSVLTGVPSPAPGTSGRVRRLTTRRVRCFGSPPGPWHQAGQARRAINVLPVDSRTNVSGLDEPPFGLRDGASGRSPLGDRLHRPHDLVAVLAGRNSGVGPWRQRGERVRPLSDQPLCLLLAVMSGKDHVQLPVVSEGAALEEEREGHDTAHWLGRAQHAPARVELRPLGADRGRYDVGHEALELRSTLFSNRVKDYVQLIAHGDSKTGERCLAVPASVPRGRTRCPDRFGPTRVIEPVEITARQP